MALDPIDDNTLSRAERKCKVIYLQVENGQTVPVSPADDAVQVLKFSGQEGPESSLYSDGLSLGEAQEVCTSDAPH